MATFRTGYPREVATFLSSLSGTSNGYHSCQQNATSAGLASEFTKLDATGTAEDATVHAMVVGWNMAASSGGPNVSNLGKRKQRVNSSKNAERILYAVFDGANISTPFLAGIKDISVSRASAGVYNVTFLRPFGRAPRVIARCEGATMGAEVITNVARNGCTITTKNVANAATDFIINLVVIGQDSNEETWGEHSPLVSSQRKPKISLIKLTNGTPTVSFGATDIASVAKNGTGDYTITLNAAARYASRPCVLTECLVAGGSFRRVQPQAVTASTIRVINQTAAGAASDADAMYIFIIGSDDATQY